MVYHQALICVNGHCVSSSIDASPEAEQKFCSKCGEKTISACPNCHSEIRGRYNATSRVCLEEYKVPPYCHNCGEAYPWTLAAMEGATEIIIEADGCSDEDKEKLANSLPYIMMETPKTQLAITRIKKALLVVDEFTADAIRQFALAYGCDLTKREIGRANILALKSVQSV